MANLLRGRNRTSRTQTWVGSQNAYKYYSNETKLAYAKNPIQNNPRVPWTVALNAINFKKKEFRRGAFKYFALKDPPVEKRYDKEAGDFQRHDYLTVQETLRDAANNFTEEYQKRKLENRISGIKDYLEKKQDEAIKMETQIYQNTIQKELKEEIPYAIFLNNTTLNEGGQKITKDSLKDNIRKISTIELWTRAAYSLLIPEGDKSFFENLSEKEKEQFAFFAYIKSKELYDQLRATGEMAIFSRHKARKYGRDVLGMNIDTEKNIQQVIDKESLLVLDKAFDLYLDNQNDVMIKEYLRQVMNDALGVYLVGKKELKEGKQNVSATQVSKLIRDRLSEAMVNIHKNFPNIDQNLTIKLGEKDNYFLIVLDPTKNTSMNKFHKLKLQEQMRYLQTIAQDGDEKTFREFLQEDKNALDLINKMIDLIGDIIDKKIQSRTLNLLGMGKFNIHNLQKFRKYALSFCEKVINDKNTIMAEGLISDLWASFNTNNSNAFVSGLLGELGALYSINKIFNKRGSMTGSTWGNMGGFGQNVNDLTYSASGLFETDRQPTEGRKGIRRNSKETKLGINVKHYVDHTGNQFTLYKSEKGISVNNNAIKKYLDSEEVQLLRFITANSGLFSASFIEQMAISAAYSNIPNFYRLQDRSKTSAINVLFEINNVVYPLSYIYSNALYQLNKAAEDSFQKLNLFSADVENKEDSLYSFKDISEARKKWDDDSFRISTRRTRTSETTVRIYTKGLNINLVSFGLFN